MKFCPRCAVEMETQILNDLPRRLCPACGNIYWNNPLPAAGAAVIDRNGHILLVRRAIAPRLGAWNLPAGYMEFGESAEAGAVREVREETGLEVELLGFLASAAATHPRWPWSSISFIFFYARPVGGTLAPGDDADRALFYPPDALPPDIAFRTHRQALDRWQSDRERGALRALGL